jgi:hypothetical protein
MLPFPMARVIQPLVRRSCPYDKPNKPLVEYRLRREPRINKLCFIKFNRDKRKQGREWLEQIGIEGDKYDDGPILTVGQCAVWP